MPSSSYSSYLTALKRQKSDKGGMRISILVTVWLTMPWLVADGTDQHARNRDDREDDRVCFYMHVNYEGPEWCYRPGDELADFGRRRNEISSIRVFGRARVVVFDQRGFSGEAEEFTANVADLTLRHLGGSRTWNDRIDSFQVQSVLEDRGRGEWRRARPSGRENPFGRNGGVCVYEFAGFRGRSECWKRVSTSPISIVSKTGTIASARFACTVAGGPASTATRTFTGPARRDARHP
jgi:hypothetical protein